MNSSYGPEDAIRAYAGLGLDPGSVVYCESDISSFGLHAPHHATAISKSHLNALIKVLGPSGTVVVPAGSPSLHRSGAPYYPAETPSEWGVFSEYVRTLKDSVRSHHAFCSFAALGGSAEAVCADASRHDYGAHTPMRRLIDRDAIFLSLGLHPRYTTTAIHQVEFEAGVPYRYVREYEHPVATENGLENELFYRHVWYHACEIQKAPKDKWVFWDRFAKSHAVRRARLGRGYVYAYSIRDFYEFALDAMVKNQFLLLDQSPSKRPYRERM